LPPPLAPVISTSEPGSSGTVIGGITVRRAGCWSSPRPNIRATAMTRGDGVTVVGN
jgi:hypothetical protein